MDYMDFRKKIATDKDFKAKFVDCKSSEELITAAAAEGYTFTEEDIRNNTEILPEELDSFVGGINLTSTYDHHHIIN